MLRKPLTGAALTDSILGAAIEVHRELGPGFLEAIYEEALCIALTDAGLRFERQKSVDVLFRGQVVGQHRLDLFVENQAVVELKAIKVLEDIHFATVRSYMRSLQTEIGLLLNFSSMPLCIKRVAPYPKGSL